MNLLRYAEMISQIIVFFVEASFKYENVNRSIISDIGAQKIYIG